MPRKKRLKNDSKVFFSGVDVQRRLSDEEGLIRTACRPLSQVATYQIIPQAHAILPIDTEKGMIP